MKWRFAIFAVGMLIFSFEAQAQVLKGWSLDETSKETTVLIHESGNARIMIGPATMGSGGANEVLKQFAARIDKPEGCAGISKKAILPSSQIANSVTVESSGAIKCTILVAPLASGSALQVLAFETANANLGSKELAVLMAKELSTKLGGIATTMQKSAPSPKLNAPVQTPAQVNTKPPVSNVAKASVGLRGQLARASEPRGLIGMWRSDWVTNRYDAFAGMQLVAMDNTLIFTPGGYFFNSVPDSLSIDEVGAQAAMRENPDSAGRYVVGAKTITLNYPNGDVEEVDYKKEGTEWTLTFRNRVMSPKMLFQNGGGLKGAYSTTRITNAGSAGFVVGADDYDFSLDGRFAKGGSVSLSGGPVSSIAGRTVRGGTYVIRNSALYLSYADGEKEVYSLFQESHGGPIWLNSQMYKPAGYKD